MYGEIRLRQTDRLTDDGEADQVNSCNRYFFLNSDCTDSARLNVRLKAANPAGWMEQEENECRKTADGGLRLISGLSGNRFMSPLSFSSCWDTVKDVSQLLCIFGTIRLLSEVPQAFSFSQCRLCGSTS